MSSGNYDGSLVFDTKIDVDGFNKGTNTITKQAGNLESTFKKLSGVIAGAFAVTKIVQFGKEAVEIASDMQEVQNVVDTAFGDMAYKMEEFASTAIETYGISKLTAKQTGSNYMAMGKGMGLAASAASDMALVLTGLSADMSSFYNVTQDVANTALKSVYTGETESLKQFGIVMTEANLNAFALAQGITKSYSAMSQAEKVQLRYAYVMQQTALAQGDFAKTSDSWANQTRILSERWKEFLSIIGNGLIKVLTPVIKFLNNVMSALIKFANTVGSVLSKIFGFESTASNTTTSIAEIADSTDVASNGVSDLGDTVKDTSKKINKSLSPMDELNSISGEIADSAESASDSLSDIGVGGIDYSTGEIGAIETTPAEDSINGFVDRMVAKMQEFGSYMNTNFKPIFTEIWFGMLPEIQTYKETLGGVFNDIQSLWEPFTTYVTGSFVPMLQTAFKTVGDIATGFMNTWNTVFADVWNNAVYPLAEKFVSTFLPMITDNVTYAIEAFGVFFDETKKIFDMLWTDAINPSLTLVIGIILDLVDAIKEFFDKWAKPIWTSFMELMTKVGSTLQNIWNTVLKPVWDVFMSTVDELWTDHLKPFLDNVLDLVGELANGALEIINKFILPIVNKFVDVFGPYISTVFSGLVKTIGNFLGNLVDVANGIITALKGVIQFVTGVFTGNWKKAWTGIQNIFKGIWDGLVNIVKTPVNLIIGIMNTLMSAVATAINTIVKAVNKLSVTVPDWVPGIGGKSLGFSLPTVTAPTIPKLATGTVVPANYGEFTAILGDNKREPEVVSPLSTMKQALAETLAELGVAGNGEQTIILQIDGRELTRTVVKQDKEYRNKTGQSLFAY